VLADAEEAWKRREETLTSPVTRELERRVVLSVLDRKWREHLYEMDYLKEGIGLRAMAQRDPLVEYQREGFDMFAAMLDSLKEESVGFLYNLQVQVVPADQVQAPAAASPAASVGAAPLPAAAVTSGNGGQPAAAPAPARRRVQRPVEALPTQQAASANTAGAAEATSAPAALRAKGLGNGSSGSPALTYTGPREDGGTETRSTGSGGAAKRQAGAAVTSSKEPGRNSPCPCGSGKKYKLCHGRPGAV
jgi:preprotein translocase subunit SecA